MGVSRAVCPAPYEVSAPILFSTRTTRMHLLGLWPPSKSQTHISLTFDQRTSSHAQSIGSNGKVMGARPLILNPTVSAFLVILFSQAMNAAGCATPASGRHPPTDQMNLQ